MKFFKILILLLFITTNSYAGINLDMTKSPEDEAILNKNYTERNIIKVI